MQSRVQTLEQALLSGEGGAIEEQITLTLVKKGKKLSIIPTYFKSDFRRLIAKIPSMYLISNYPLSMCISGVIDCENSTQCDDDKACMDSLKKPGRMLCEPVCER